MTHFVICIHLVIAGLPGAGAAFDLPTPSYSTMRDCIEAMGKIVQPGAGMVAACEQRK